MNHNFAVFAPEHRPAGRADGSGPLIGRRSFAVLLAALLTLLVVLRSPENLATPQFYAEDGGLFFQEAYNNGFITSLNVPTAGYLNTLPRLMAGAALLVPLEMAPLVVALLALLVQMLPVFYLLSSRATAIIPSFPRRCAVALLYVILPNSDEVYVSGTNAQWHLMLVGALILLIPPPANRLGRAAETFLAAIFAFTGPGSLLLLPLVLLVLRGRCTPGRGLQGGAALAVVAAGAVTQLAFLVTSPRIAGARVSGLTSLDPGEIVRIISTHTFYSTFLGEQRFTRVHESFGLAPHIAGLLVVMLLGWSVVRHRVRPLLLLGYLALVTIFLSLLFPSNELTLWLKPWFGSRYYFHATLFLVCAVADLLTRKGPWLFLGALLAVPLATLAVPSDFFLPKWPDTRYRDQIEQFRSLPAGARFFIPTLPEPWGMTLTRKADALPVAPRLARLQPLPQEAGARLDPVWVSDAGDRIRISGSAADPVAGAPAGGVTVLVDGRLFPAVYGQAWSFRGGDLAEPSETAFQRVIPVSEIGRGMHSLALLVLTHDRTAVFRPAAPFVFTLP